MWKRERMMVDVISLQKPEEEHPSSLQHSPLIPKITNNNDSLPITQNRHYYAFQGLHDRQTRFYPGYEYDVFCEHPTNPDDDDKRSKRPLNLDDDNNDDVDHIKKQKLLQPQLDTSTASTTDTIPNGYTFSSKPYDAMDNVMYYY